jgi:hypothetical protein
VVRPLLLSFQALENQGGDDVGRSWGEVVARAVEIDGRPLWYIGGNMKSPALNHSVLCWN